MFVYISNQIFHFDIIEKIFPRTAGSKNTRIFHLQNSNHIVLDFFGGGGSERDKSGLGDNIAKKTKF